ncbi:C2 calcium-dependent domain-containing protein 4C-like isoform X1 [Scyliorhinus torazame]|uniref:C2 calcium-dependent domain-containing protein 4C-like isoform X1 n=1 Tax=Scyliorhinus torazame TaxID=75743 RepID=UPI003B5CD6A1
MVQCSYRKITLYLQRLTLPARPSSQAAVYSPGRTHPSSPHRRTMLYVNVLTPDRVPEFFIPPKFTPQLQLQKVRATTVKTAAVMKQVLQECHLAAPGAWDCLKAQWVLVDGRTAGDSTDWDPGSRAALSLPHLPRADTPYGFCRLLESPHTRRKESLFHIHPAVPPGISPTCSRPSAPGSPGSAPASPPQPSCQQPPRARCWRKLLGSSARKGGRFRRGDSLASSPGSSLERGAKAVQGAPCPLGHSLTKESIATLGGSGILRLRAEFSSEGQRVWIRLLSVEGLYEQFTDCQTINCCLSLHLKPGNEQKQQSAVIRRSRNPIFNQDFCFFGITGDQLQSRFLKIKVMNKVSRLRRHSVLGVCQLSLAGILPP